MIDATILILRENIRRPYDSMLTFEYDTYVVFDMPSADWTQRVLDLRRKYDPDRSELPIEITVIGSSGVGVFELDQNPTHAFALLDQLAAKLAPITFALETVERFPGTNLFYLATSAVEKFRAVQTQIVATGLRFKDSPFPFTPHCTIASLRADDLAQGEPEIRAFPLPIAEITLDEMRVYSLNQLDCQLLFQTRLRGRS